MDSNKKVLLQLEVDRETYFLILEACLNAKETIDEFIAKAIQNLILSDRASKKPVS